ncbi:MAG: CPBP family intramembrane glutamic endopeptidase [Candidatus Enteromonas sp.]|nr:CPBP family intramembrane glutamic endopeptidase [Candidatus Enteromonas sp.]
MANSKTSNAKKPEMRTLWLLLYFLCLYLAVNLMPFSWFFNNENVIFGCQIGLKTLLLAYFIWECLRKENRKNIGLAHLRGYSLIWVPLLLPCFSNLFYCSFFSGSFVVPSDITHVVLLLVDDLVVACMEEIIFRGLLFSFFCGCFQNKKKGPIYAILLSSPAFASLHLVNFLSSDPLAVLAQIGYSFVLGIILCAVYAGSQNLVLPILGHFLFNAFNDTLPSSFLVFSTEIPYLFWSLAFALFGLLYAGIVFIVMQKRTANVS